MEYLIGMPIDETNYEVKLEQCQEYLLELFLIFSTIYPVTKTMKDVEIEKILIGF